MTPSWGSEEVTKNFVQFEGKVDSVEWNRMILDKDIDDDSLMLLILGVYIQTKNYFVSN